MGDLHEGAKALVLSIWAVSTVLVLRWVKITNFRPDYDVMLLFTARNIGSCPMGSASSNIRALILWKRDIFLRIRSEVAVLTMAISESRTLGSWTYKCQYRTRR